MMKVFEKPLTKPDVTLTGYLLSASHEMPNAKTRPAILIMPGGAYRNCSDREAEPVAMAFLAKGFHAFVLRYSLNGNATFPAPLHDAEEALNMIRQHSGEWGIDSEKIAVCGFSAGGHLAAAVGTMGRVRPNAIILGYPCILASDSPIFPHAIPSVDHVDDQTPPAFIFHTSNDSLVPVKNALAFASAMERMNLPFELHVFADGVHGLSLGIPSTSGGLQSMVNEEVSTWFELCCSWIRKVFGEFPHEKEHSWDEEKYIDNFGVETVLGILWKNQQSRNLILEHLPMLEHTPQLSDAMGVPLRVILDYSGGLVTSEQVDQLDRALKEIKV